MNVWHTVMLKDVLKKKKKCVQNTMTPKGTGQEKNKKNAVEVKNHLVKMVLTKKIARLKAKPVRSCNLEHSK